MVHGESGSGKTMLTRLLMDLIDPRDEKALSIPKDDRALIVFAKQTFLVGFENISLFRDGYRTRCAGSPAAIPSCL